MSGCGKKIPASNYSILAYPEKRKSPADIRGLGLYNRLMLSY